MSSRITENNAEGWTLPKGMADYGQSSSTLGMSMAQGGQSPQTISSALETNARGSLPEGQQPATGLVKAWGAGASTTLLPELLPSSLSATSIIGSGLIGGGVNIANQLTNDKPFSVTDALIAAGTSAVSEGRGYVTTGVISGLGAYSGAVLQGKGTLAPTVGAVIGSLGGKYGGNLIGNELKPTISNNELWGSVGGAVISEKTDEHVENKIKTQQVKK
ncbi:hypothetical protein HVC08_002260 [Salmonella enterica]|nr:hypothetical protein [Salmonella enterica]